VPYVRGIARSRLKTVSSI